MTSFTRIVTLFFTLLFVAGCGGGGGGTGSSAAPNSGGSAALGANPGNTPVPTATLRLDFALERSVPKAVSEIRLSGFNSQGALVYGPVTRAKQTTLVFENVPLSVVSIQLDYLQGNDIFASGTTSVSLQPDQELILEDLGFDTLEAQLESIRLELGTEELPRGLTSQLRVIGLYDDNSQKDITALVNISLSAPIAELGDDYSILANQEGELVLTASLGDQESTKTLTIVPAVIQELRLTSALPTVPVGLTNQLNLEALFSDGILIPVSPDQVSWAVSPVGQIDPESGVFRGAQIGTVTVTAHVLSQSAQLELTVTEAVVTRIQIEPLQIGLPLGAAQSLKVVGFLSDGTQTDVTDDVGWTLQNSSSAAVENSILQTFQPDEQILTATLGELQATSEVSIREAELVSIQVTPQNAQLPVGLDRQFRAVGQYTDGSSLDITDLVNWSSPEPGAQIGLDGKALGVQLGSTYITARMDSIEGRAPLEISSAVLSQLRVEPASSSQPAGVPQKFSAIAILSDGNQIDVSEQAQWSSEQSSGVTVSPLGLARSLSPTSSPILALYEGFSSSANFVVTEAEPTTLGVFPNQATLADGLNQQYTAVADYTDGQQRNVTGLVLWNSSAPGTAGVESSGLATALNPGDTDIIATLKDLEASGSLTVTEAELLSLSLDPSELSLYPGISGQLRVTGLFTDATERLLSPPFQFTTELTDVVSVSPSGQVSVLNQGQTRVKVAVNGLEAESDVTVTDIPVVSLEIILDGTILSEGGEYPAQAVAEYADGSVRNLDEEVFWDVTDNSLLSVDSYGRVTALAIGQAEIIGTFDGQTARLGVEIVSQCDKPIDYILNQTREGDQTSPSIDQNGAFHLLVWEGPFQDGFGVYSNTVARTQPDLLVSENPAFSPPRPDVAVAPCGRKMIAWEQDGVITFRAYDREDQAEHTPQTLFFQTSPQSHPKVEWLQTGEFAFCWQTSDGQVWGLLLDPENLGETRTPFAISDGAGEQITPYIASRVREEFVAIWAERSPSGDFDIRARYFENGAPTGASFTVNEVTEFDQTEPCVDSNPSGDFSISWTSEVGPDDTDVYARTFVSEGNSSTETRMHPELAGRQNHSSVAATHRITPIVQVRCEDLGGGDHQVSVIDNPNYTPPSTGGGGSGPYFPGTSSSFPTSSSTSDPYYQSSGGSSYGSYPWQVPSQDPPELYYDLGATSFTLYTTPVCFYESDDEEGRGIFRAPDHSSASSTQVKNQIRPQVLPQLGPGVPPGKVIFEGHDASDSRGILGGPGLYTLYAFFVDQYIP